MPSDRFRNRKCLLVLVLLFAACGDVVGWQRSTGSLRKGARSLSSLSPPGKRHSTTTTEDSDSDAPEPVGKPKKSTESEDCMPYLAQDPCAYVLSNKRCDFERVDYLRIHYCGVVGNGQPVAVSFVCMLSWVIILFCALTITADTFFAPAVANISKWMNLPSDVAGATLLALGNGGPDFFTQVAAITHGEQADLPLAMGEGVGAGSYVSCMGVAAVIMVAPGGVVQLQPGPFMRDATALLVGLLVATTASMDDAVTTDESVMFLFWYMVYLWVVIFGAKVTKVVEGLTKAGLRHQGYGPVPNAVGALPGTEAAARSVEMTEHRGSHNGETTEARSDADGAAAEVILPERDSSAGAISASADGESVAVAGVADIHETVAVNRHRAPDTPGEPSTSSTSGAHAAPAPEHHDQRFVHEHPSPTGWLDACRVRGGDPAASWWRGPFHQLASWLRTYSGIDDEESICFLLPVTATIRLILATTMADPASGVVSPLHLMIMAFCVPTLFCFLAGFDLLHLTGSERAYLGGLRFTLMVVSLIWSGGKPLVARDSKLVSLLGFGVGMVWMDIVADELVASFQAIGRVLGLAEALLGGTIMCWAASAGDVAAAMAISRSGSPTMAAAACFGGPVFQLLMGTGVSLLYVNLERGAVPVHMGNNLHVLFAFAMLMQAYYLIGVPLYNKFLLTRRFAYGLGAAYTVFVVVYAVVAFV